MRKSRLAILAFGFFFFHAVLAGAYIRCLEAWHSAGNYSEAAKASIQNRSSEDGALHCPEDPTPYRLLQAQHSVKKEPRIDRKKLNGSQVLIPVVIGHTTLANYAGRSFGVPLLSPFPYPSIAIYQSKVVYRI